MKLTIAEEIPIPPKYGETSCHTPIAPFLNRCPIANSM